MLSGAHLLDLHLEERLDGAAGSRSCWRRGRTRKTTWLPSSLTSVPFSVISGRRDDVVVALHAVTRSGARASTRGARQDEVLVAQDVVDVERRSARSTFTRGQVARGALDARRSAPSMTISTLPSMPRRGEHRDDALGLRLGELDARRRRSACRRACRAASADAERRAARARRQAVASSRAAAGRRSTAPPTQIGERMLPARARPVPFCRHGFLPPPRTNAARLGRRACRRGGSRAACCTTS